MSYLIVESFKLLPNIVYVYITLQNRSRKLVELFNVKLERNPLSYNMEDPYLLQLQNGTLRLDFLLLLF